MNAPACRSEACRKPLRKRADRDAWEGAHGWCESCCRRWHKAGRPASGPPPPKSRRHLTAPPDPYELAWYASLPERRIDRARPLAADLIRCVDRRDAEGVRLLLARVRDVNALLVVLAECAGPERAAVVCGMAAGRRVA